MTIENGKERCLKKIKKRKRDGFLWSDEKDLKMMQG